LRSLRALEVIGSDSDLRRETRIAAAPISKMGEQTVAAASGDAVMDAKSVRSDVRLRAYREAARRVQARYSDIGARSRAVHGASCSSSRRGTPQYIA
jgi:hypothetical protein